MKFFTFLVLHFQFENGESLPDAPRGYGVVLFVRRLAEKERKKGSHERPLQMLFTHAIAPRSRSIGKAPFRRRPPAALDIPTSRTSDTSPNPPSKGDLGQSKSGFMYRTSSACLSDYWRNRKVRRRHQRTIVTSPTKGFSKARSLIT